LSAVGHHFDRHLRELSALYALDAGTRPVLAGDTMNERDLFIAALAIPGPAERSVWLDRECGDDAVLRRRIDVLLRAFDAAGSLLEQTEPVRRKVALKVLKPGMDTRQVVARFEAERQALAIMDHPNVAKVFDGGATPSGRPYFVMELVRGVPITDFCDQNHLSPRRRLELFATVCQAVQHAHQKGLVHRDLKPSNVLVSRHDTTPIVKVIDFGVAKALGQALTEKTLFTGIAQMIGTPLYMSPEQAGMSDLDVDTRSDVYSLGVLLYELLTGTTPFTKERFKTAAYDEIRRIIREEDPPKPSTRLSGSTDSLASISASRQTEPAKLTRLVRGDLDWIVMKCLEKDRNRRYETASGLAADVHRHLADEPVQACPPSAGYRLRKFGRRNRKPLGTAALLLAALLVGAGVATWQAVRATRAERQALEEASATARERDEKTAALRRAGQELAAREAVLGFVENKVFAAARPRNQAGGHGYDVKLADAVRAALPAVDQSFAAQPLVEARLRMTIGKSFWYLGDSGTAIEQIRAARALYARHRGPDDPDTLRAAHNLATAYWSAGRVSEALRLFEELVRLREVKIGPDHPDTLASMNNLAASYYATGHTDEALKLFEKTLALRKAKLGPDHADTLGNMSNLGEVYIATGRAEEAVTLMEETLRLTRTKLGPDHPDTFLVMMVLANSYSAAGRTRQALELGAETLRLRKDKLGPDHPDTLASMMNLGNYYYRADRTDDALKLYEEVLGLQKAGAGADHPNTLKSMTNLAVSYLKAGRPADALAVLKDALPRRQRRAAAEPSDTEEQANLAWTHGLVGDAEQARHDYPAAVEAFTRSVATFGQLDQAGTLKDPFFRGQLTTYRQSLAFCRKAEQAGRDLDFALRQPATEVPELLYARVCVLLSEQKVAAAVESAAKMKDRAADDGEQLYNAACAYALCAGGPGRAGAADATPLARQSADDAVALLKRAVARGFKDPARLKRDRDLDSLRGREDFKKLLAELEANPK
jgi:serine/threonine protein kinase/tetratricopeptide (TPR) repeat protein